MSVISIKLHVGFEGVVPSVEGSVEAPRVAQGRDRQNVGGFPHKLGGCLQRPQRAVAGQSWAFSGPGSPALGTLWPKYRGSLWVHEPSPQPGHGCPQPWLFSTLSAARGAERPSIPSSLSPSITRRRRDWPSLRQQPPRRRERRERETIEFFGRRHQPTKHTTQTGRRRFIPFVACCCCRPRHAHAWDPCTTRPKKTQAAQRQA